MSINDDKILALKKKIEEKKKKVGAKFNPITNCSIVIDGNRINLHTVNDKMILLTLMVQLNSLYLSAKDLGVENEYEYTGHKLMDWITDIKSRYDVVCSKEEGRNLKAMEAKLTKLLSDDKKTELELDDLTKEFDDLDI